MKLDETGADGFVPARTLGKIFSAIDEASHALVGDHTGETHRLGDTVTVKLVEAAPVAGALRFECLSEGRYEPGQSGSLGAAVSSVRRSGPSARAAVRQKKIADERHCRALTKVERDQSHPNLKPRDAATLIVVDRAGAGTEGAARQASRRPQVHGRKVRVSRRPRGAR